MTGSKRDRRYGRGARSFTVASTASLALALAVSACAKLELPAHLKPLPEQAVMHLGKLGMTATDPIFIRIFKEESELEVWKQRADGHFYHFKTYPICNWSGGLGPKIKQGDKQAPEGFYQVAQYQMKPDSDFHLAFNIGYPNAFDKSLNRTGNFLMVHGKCRSAGCYAMTDALIEEIYALARESFIGGQQTFHLHAYPFRMTNENLLRHVSSPHIEFWKTLKQGYDHFELTRQLPEIAVCERKYHVNVALPKGKPQRIDPAGRCPRFEHPVATPFVPLMPAPAGGATIATTSTGSTGSVALNPSTGQAGLGLLTASTPQPARLATPTGAN